MKNKLIFFIFILSLYIPINYVFAYDILSNYRYAWSNNIGYINFENVTVSDIGLSGYAWSENSGWIKFNPTNGGVFNDGNGNLSGSAWGEGLGWIDFNHVSISTSTGKFSGTATGDMVGIINFDCPNYCDVRTDWSVASNTVIPLITQTSSSSNSRGSGYLIDNSVIQHVDISDNSLILTPQQSGILNRDTSIGKIIVEIPANNIINKTTFTIDEEVLSSNNDFLVYENNNLINGFFYNISAADENGNLIHEFVKPIKITLPIAKNQIGVNGLKLYWLNEKKWSWVLIPDAVFTKDKVVFSVNHLTKFAIFEDKKIDTINKKNESNIYLPKEKKSEYEKIINKKISVDNVRDEKVKNGKNIFDIYQKLLLLLLIVIIIFLIKNIIFK